MGKCGPRMALPSPTRVAFVIYGFRPWSLINSLTSGKKPPSQRGGVPGAFTPHAQLYNFRLTRNDAHNGTHDSLSRREGGEVSEGQGGVARGLPGNLPLVL